MKKEIKYVGGRMSGKSFFDDELSPLEAFYDLLSPIGLKEEGLKRYNLIETTLKDYATRKTLIETIDSGEMVFEERTVWEETQNKLKALEIIKEKGVNVQNFKNACSTMSYEQYFFMWKDGCFMGIMLTSKTMLTQDEFDLLKEVLKNE